MDEHAGPQPGPRRVEPDAVDPAEVPAVPVIADWASGRACNRRVSCAVAADAGVGGCPVSAVRRLHHRGRRSWPGSARERDPASSGSHAQPAACGSAACRGSRMPGDPVMSRPCGPQCSASRVVAGVAGFSRDRPPDFSGSCPGRAHPERGQRRLPGPLPPAPNTLAGRGPFGPAGSPPRRLVLVWSRRPCPAGRAPTGGPAAAPTPSSDWARCSTASAIVQPALPDRVDVHWGLHPRPSQDLLRAALAPPPGRRKKVISPD